MKIEIDRRDVEFAALIETLERAYRIEADAADLRKLRKIGPPELRGVRKALASKELHALFIRLTREQVFPGDCSQIAKSEVIEIFENMIKFWQSQDFGSRDIEFEIRCIDPENHE